MLLKNICLVTTIAFGLIERLIRMLQPLSMVIQIWIKFTNAEADGELNFHIDGSFTDEMPSTLRPNARDYVLIDGYEIINASVSYIRDDWTVTLYANNLTNNYATFGGRFAANSVIAGQQGAWNFVNRPRTVGLDLRTKF